MRLDATLDTVYALSALWGSSPARQICPSNPSLSKAAVELTRSSGYNAVAAVTAFVNVNVVPMDSERVLPNHTVLVKGGRITALGPVHQVKVPAGAVRIDSHGKYLMPGLADMHRGAMHSIDAPRSGGQQAFLDEMFISYLAHGVTSLRAVQGGSSNSDVQYLQRLFAEFPIPRMYLAPPMFPNFQSNPDSVITGLKAAGYSHLLSLPANADTISALLQTFRRRGLPIATHGHGIPFPRVLQLGASRGSVEHLYLFWDTLFGVRGPAGTDAKEEPAPIRLSMAKVPALAAAVQRAGTWVTPTLACMEIAFPHIQDNGLGRLVKALQDAGVKMLLGGDGIALSRSSVHNELVALVRAGLTPYQALLTGTRNVAEYFGILDSAGTVAIGKRADLVLLSSNPLQNVRHTWGPEGVMIDGRWLDRATLDQRLLASPRVWFQELLARQMPDPYVLNIEGALKYFSQPVRSMAQWEELARHGQRVLTLVDSLNPANRQTYTRVLPRVTAELGRMRGLMNPIEREAFDVNIQAWIRDQARQGTTVAIPDLSPRS